MALPLSESGVEKGDRNIWRKPVRRKDMEKIFKKSLALILSAALCLTALVGCLTVSAAEGDTTKPVYSVNSVEGAAGAEVDVVASFSEISNVCAHHVIFTFPAGLEVTAVKNAAGEAYTAFDNSGDRFDYKLDKAEDGSTKVQFLDFVNWAAEGLSTSDMSIHFTVKIAADAAANTEYTVTIAVQAADYAAENLLDVTLTNGKVTVKAAVTTDYITYTGSTYDVTTNELSIKRAAPSDALIAKMKEASAAGHRVVSLIVMVGQSEYSFSASITSGVGAFNVKGFAVADLLQDVTCYIRVTADGDYKFETNKYTVNISELIASMAETDVKAAAMNTFINTTKDLDEEIAVSNATLEEGLIGYTTVTFNSAVSGVTIGRTVPSDELKAVLTEAKNNGNRKVELVVTVGETEYLFPASITTGTGAFTVKGFALNDFKSTVTVGIRITSGASGEHVVNTNKAILDIDSAISSATDSAYANAYNALYAAE